MLHFRHHVSFNFFFITGKTSAIFFHKEKFREYDRFEPITENLKKHGFEDFFKEKLFLVVCFFILLIGNYFLLEFSLHISKMFAW